MNGLTKICTIAGISLIGLMGVSTSMVHAESPDAKAARIAERREAKKEARLDDVYKNERIAGRRARAKAGRMEVREDATGGDSNLNRSERKADRIADRRIANKDARKAERIAARRDRQQYDRLAARRHGQ